MADEGESDAEGTRKGETIPDAVDHFLGSLLESIKQGASGARPGDADGDLSKSLNCQRDGN